MGKLTRLRREITTFSQQNNEQLHESWERFKELLRSCPHHEVPKWQQIQSFYSGLDERNRQMVDSSCGGTFLHKTADEAWDLFENLSDNSQQHATSSGVGTSRQIGNRGMFEVSQNVDLSVKVDALSKKFDQLLALNTLPTNSTNVQSVCAICSSPSHLETQIGQLANAISRRDEGKLPSHPIENPRANYHEQANAVITIRNGKLVDNKVGEPIKDKTLPLMCSKDYTFIEKENLICTENVNSNLAYIAPPENSSLIVNHELNMREIDPG
ncbi:hypothetical protein M9H77_36050 [Catharanthus roseus]|uniref:Uncharacterized protein n=1 Tax=Catharanthus roseus TaxID=4058 RepID=A0ACB9ZR16_CATRO|nr:hypothetical protein M9H77_36050 [Catharanthus roseus]